MRDSKGKKRWRSKRRKKKSNEKRMTPKTRENFIKKIVEARREDFVAKTNENGFSVAKTCVAIAIHIAQFYSLWMCTPKRRDQISDEQNETFRASFFFFRSFLFCVPVLNMLIVLRPWSTQRLFELPLDKLRKKVHPSKIAENSFAQ